MACFRSRFHDRGAQIEIAHCSLKGEQNSLNRISRRDGLLALAAATVRGARADGGLLHVTRVDHVALAVEDIDNALVFYRSLFGNEVLKDSRTARRYLRLGPCYMAIAPAAAGEAKRIDHIGIGIANFNASTLKTSLEGAGFKVRESNLGLFVADPDGTSLQIWVDESWKQLRNSARYRVKAGGSVSSARDAPRCDSNQRWCAVGRILQKAVR
jgi:hypothetical protein